MAEEYPVSNYTLTTTAEGLTTSAKGWANTTVTDYFYTTYPHVCYHCHCSQKKSIKELMVELKERLQEAHEEKEAARELRMELKKFITERMDG